jgi:hypothetical protein
MTTMTSVAAGTWTVDLAIHRLARQSGEDSP